MLNKNNVSLCQCVKEMAAESKKQGQKFLVMRNYQELPDRNVARDIDVMIPKNTIVTWRRIIDNVSKKLGLSCRTGRQYLYVSEEFVSNVDSSELQFDIEPRMNWLGVDWLNNEDCIKRARLFKDNIWIPHPADECVISFCMSYLYGGFVKEKYLPLMSELAKNNKDEVLKILSNVFGKKIAAKIVDSLINKDIRDIAKNAARHRLIVLLRGFLRHPVTFIFTFPLNYYLDVKAKRQTKKELTKV